MSKTICQILTNYYNGNEVTSFKKGSKKEIRKNSIFNKLERVWNNGMGLISFAKKDTDNVLLINKLFCNKKEIIEIEKTLTVPFEFVELGYPDYYSKGLEQMRVKI